MKFLLLLLLTTQSFSAEFVKGGTIIENDSVVFSVDEAQELRKEILELEDMISKGEQLVSELRKLDSNNRKQIDSYLEIIDLKDRQITSYRSTIELDRDRVVRLEKRERGHKVEKWVFLGVGIGITIGSLLIADKIDDYVETPQNQPNTFKVRF